MGSHRPKNTMNTALIVKLGLIGAGALLGIIIHQNLPEALKNTVGK